jgi:hypothetical protein
MSTCGTAGGRKSERGWDARFAVIVTSFGFVVGAAPISSCVRVATARSQVGNRFP